MEPPALLHTAHCVATSMKLNSPHGQAGGISFLLSGHIANRSSECHLVLFCHCFLPELGRRARMATNATQTHAVLAPENIAV